MEWQRPVRDRRVKTGVGLRARMLGAAKWVVVGSAGGHLLRLITNLITTRLLAPEMFGLMSVATTVGTIMAMLSDIGLRQAVIRSPRGDEHRFLDTAWTLQVLRGWALWLGGVMVALALAAAAALGVMDPASTYANPMLPWLIAATSFSSVIISHSSTIAMTAIREFDMRRIFLLDISGQIFGLVVMVAVAWTTGSIWALVAGTLASTLCSAVLSNVWSARRNWFAWDKEAVREILSFGRWVVASSSVTVFANTGDRLMLAAYANAHLLGLYSIALSISGAVGTLMSQLFDRVMLPAFSEVARKEPHRVPEAYFRLRRRMDPLVLTISGALCAGAPVLIGLLYDSRYADSGRILSLLSVAMVLDRYAVLHQIYIAIGKPEYLLPINIVRLASVYTLIPLAYTLFGFEAAIAMIALRDLPVLPLVLWFNSKHGLNSWRMELTPLVLWPLSYGAVAGLRALFS